MSALSYLRACQVTNYLADEEGDLEVTSLRHVQEIFLQCGDVLKQPSDLNGHAALMCT